MKKHFTYLILAAIISTFSGFITNPKAVYKFNNLSSDSIHLIRPEAIHLKKAKILSYLVSFNHYKKMTLNDSLSSEIFDIYLKQLDPNKLYFLESDIQQFEQYRNELDNDLLDANLDAPYLMFNTYMQRMAERMTRNKETLKQNFDFTTNETYDTERDHVAWSKSTNELDDVWRKIIKSQLLNYKISGDSLSKAKENLDKRYDRYIRNIEKTNSEDIFQTFMNSVTEAYDPHTTYFSPISAENFNNSMKKSLEGIGAVLRMENDYTTITSIRAGGPAYKSKKLHPDDKIIAVAQDKDDFVDVIGWRLDDVVQLIRGKKGSIVRLKILSAKEGADARPKIISLIRDKITFEEQSAQKDIIELEENGKKYKIGIIKIPSFYIDFEAYRSGDTNYKSTTNDVKKLIKELQEERVDGLVIDLRFNGGGSLKEAIDLTGLFIHTGPVVQVKTMSGKIDVLEDDDDTFFYNGPLAVLVNRFSASASEIFSGAIQDYHRGIIIGDQTFGKGSVQNIIDLNRFLPDEEDKLGQLNLTVSKYYRITGSSTQHKGVIPDIELPSAYDKNKFGESSKKSALQWDEIPSSVFTGYNYISDKLIQKVQKSYEKRLEKDEELKELMKDIQKVKEEIANTKISLNEVERLKEKEDDKEEKVGKEEEIEEGEDSEEKEDLSKDPYIKNGSKILVDMIQVAS